jgi:hypothetical protein
MRVSRACADANGDGMHGYIVRNGGDSTVLVTRVA